MTLHAKMAHLAVLVFLSYEVLFSEGDNPDGWRGDYTLERKKGRGMLNESTCMKNES